MSQAVLRVEGLPGAALAAAEAFYEAWMPQARAACRTHGALDRKSVV